MVAALATQPAISVKDKDKVNNTDTEEANNISVAAPYCDIYTVIRDKGVRWEDRAEIGGEVKRAIISSGAVESTAC